MADDFPKTQSIVERNPLLPEISIYSYTPEYEKKSADAQEGWREQRKSADQSTRSGGVVS
jgi:hypothetical protein